MEGYVKTESKDGIGTITFQHPQSNSLPGAILRKLAECIRMMGSDDTIRVIILKSEGEKAFCAGASFDELLSIKNTEEGIYFFSGFAEVINAMRKTPKFIIACVQGKAVGGGVGLAASADYALATMHASVKLSELAVGIGPFVVGPAVERKIGKAAYVSLSVNATEWKSAEWARQRGLYAETFETIGEMHDAAYKLATTLASSNPEAMRMLKNVFWENTDHWDTLLHERAAMSGALVLSEFTANAIRKFKSS
jgi:methylglutaconyl-CoA hydratase